MAPRDASGTPAAKTPVATKTGKKCHHLVARDGTVFVYDENLYETMPVLPPGGWSSMKAGAPVSTKQRYVGLQQVESGAQTHGHLIDSKFGGKVRPTRILRGNDAQQYQERVAEQAAA